MKRTIAAWCGALGLLLSAPALGEETEAEVAAEQAAAYAARVPSVELPPATQARSAQLVSVEERLFAGLRDGPVAPDTRDQLNEMIIRSSLSAYGVPLPPDLPAESRRLLAAVPSHLPAIGFLTSEFGTRRSPFDGRLRLHKGIDIAAPEGSPIYAAADGVVIFAGWKGPLGRVVVVNHGFRITTKYAHASKLEVRRGTYVRRGDRLGRVGNSGRSTGAHLHFEVRVGGQPIDPTRFMFDPPENLDGVLADLRSVQPDDGLLGDAEIGGGDEEVDDELGEAYLPPSAVASQAKRQTPVDANPYGSVSTATLDGYGIGGESDADDEDPEGDVAARAPELDRLVLARQQGWALLPVNLGIVGGFSVLALVLAAGDHLPRLRRRRRKD
jgi:murein DD-endopeptidase MepM/ murein hydrolase activator NlpD